MNVDDAAEQTLRPFKLETIGETDLARDFDRPTTGIRVMGVLLPVQACVKDRIVIVGSSAVVGRDPTAEIVLPDSAVSKRHARIRCDPDGLYSIEDLGSSNGTYVDNVPVLSCALHGGDSIRIGRSMFVFDRIRSFEGTTET